MATDIPPSAASPLVEPGYAPLVTLALLSYNQEEYVRDAVESALSQTYSPMQIILSDDASSDGTFARIRDAVSTYTGPHQVLTNANAANLGIGAHVNRVFQMARGELVILAAGDDISVPSRTTRTVAHWLEQGRPSAVYCDAAILRNGRASGTYATALGEIGSDPLGLISYRRRSPILVLGACGAYSRDLMERFGSLSPYLTVEDVPLAVRASLLRGVSYLKETLVCYRENVSVWLPRKLASESFLRHKERMTHRTQANLRIFEQIRDDASKYGEIKYIQAAEARLAAYAYIEEARQSQSFLPLRYLSASASSGDWLGTATFGLLYGFPRLHKALFALRELGLSPFNSAKNHASP